MEAWGSNPSSVIWFHESKGIEFHRFESHSLNYDDFQLTSLSPSAKLCEFVFGA